ncbi:MAG: PIN domain-containing protein [Terriglobia bacterium]
MRRLRIYVDSSVIGGCLDREFAKESQQIIEWARQGDIILLLSETTFTELETAPADVQNILKGLPPESLEMVSLTTEVSLLSVAYVEAGVVGSRWLNDATHVAAATVARADAIVSWNFRHIVRLEKMKGYNRVNLLNGYGILTIITPREVKLHEPDE